MFNRKGFTLIELVIVVVVIGILAAIAIPNFEKTQSRIKEVGSKQDAREVQGAVEDYANANEGYYPPHLIALFNYLPDSDNDGTPNLFKNRYTGEISEPIDGVARFPGQIGYLPQFDGYNAVVDYKITVFGPDSTSGIILTLRHDETFAN